LEKSALGQDRSPLDQEAHTEIGGENGRQTQ
jgi:hypothetical protein